MSALAAAQTHPHPELLDWRTTVEHLSTALASARGPMVPALLEVRVSLEAAGEAFEGYFTQEQIQADEEERGRYEQDLEDYHSACARAYAEASTAISVAADRAVKEDAERLTTDWLGGAQRLRSVLSAAKPPGVRPVAAKVCNELIGEFARTACARPSWAPPGEAFALALREALSDANVLLLLASRLSQEPR